MPSPAHPTLSDIRAALRHTLPPPEEHVEGRTAAVAAVLRENGRQVELLFIRRARRRGDPWSGHMAWPGGKREACDSSMAACSIRETREELGLDLQEHAHLIGTLPLLRFSGRRPAALRAVFAYVFALHGAQALQPGPEVQEAVWVPLTYFGRWSSRRPWRWVARWLPPVPPAYRYQGRLIWGLTQWLLGELLKRIRDSGSRAAGDRAEPGDRLPGS
ncbi:MAG: CoA pyrophosphatase [Acidobacteria bacterium]|nr:MAG: CoA pyrophosphatase [Acidobacteriota bacterium]